jgi:hypothetical protein
MEGRAGSVRTYLLLHREEKVSIEGGDRGRVFGSSGVKTSWWMDVDVAR